MQKEVFLISGVRSPIGRFGGGLKELSPSDLAAHAMKHALARASITGAELDLYIFGNILRAGQGQLIPRQGAIKAGIPEEVDGFAVDMVCASGMMSIMNAYYMIQSGAADLILAGGVESMSQAGFVISHRARWGYKFLLGASEELVDVLEYDGLTDSITGQGMGIQTDKLVREHKITREELDDVAYLSQKRAAEAAREGRFREEIVPITVPSRKGEISIEADEGIREDTTRDSLAKLRPAFAKDGLLTAGNSSQISDGSAAVLLASGEAVNQYRFEPRAKVLGGSWAAGEPYRFPEAPIPAVKKLLEKLGMSPADIGLYENNEAFAINTLLFQKQLGVSAAQLNVNGGAIALGHPIGASGARIVVTLLSALKQQGERYGMASICHGTGGATALAIEHLQ